MKSNRIVLLLLAASSLSFAADKWVATWGASPLATNVPAAPPAAPANGAPAAAPAKPAPLRSFNNQTVRMIVNTSIGGSSARVELSNHFGQKAVKISGQVALHAGDSKIVAGSNRPLTFAGNPMATIPPGAALLSDPVDIAVPAIGQLVVSLYFPEDSGPPTQHSTGLHSTYIAAGNVADAAEIATPERTTFSWYFLNGVDVMAPEDTKVVVTFGDSITDGATSTNNTNSDWPSQLAKRLHDEKMNVAVVNQGISGNRVLADGAGVSALARFERDVLAVPGITHLVFMEAINDIGVTSRAGQTPVTADEIISIYRQMIDRAQMRGIKVIGATLTPYQGAGYYSEIGETTRTTVNEWIRHTSLLDGVIDFDKAMQDPASPLKFKREYTNTDFLHPNDAGYKVMAESIDLGLFQ